MKTLVEQWMEKEGRQMSPNFKRQSLERFLQWRQGKVKDQEFESEWQQK